MVLLSIWVAAVEVFVLLRHEAHALQQSPGLWLVIPFSQKTSLAICSCLRGGQRSWLLAILLPGASHSRYAAGRTS